MLLIAARILATTEILQTVQPSKVTCSIHLCNSKIGRLRISPGGNSRESSLNILLKVFYLNNFTTLSC